MARTSLHLQPYSNTTQATIDAESGMRIDFGIHGAHHIVEKVKLAGKELSLKINNTTANELSVTVLHGYGPYAGSVGANHYYNPDDLPITLPAGTETDIWPMIRAAGGLHRFARNYDLSFDIDFESGLQGLPIVLSYD